jgi:hypothetical protein
MRWSDKARHEEWETARRENGESAVPSPEVLDEELRPIEMVRLRTW